MHLQPIPSIPILLNALCESLAILPDLPQPVMISVRRDNPPSPIRCPTAILYAEKRELGVIESGVWYAAVDLFRFRIYTCSANPITASESAERLMSQAADYLSGKRLCDCRIEVQSLQNIVEESDPLTICEMELKSFFLGFQ